MARFDELKGIWPDKSVDGAFGKIAFAFRNDMKVLRGSVTGLDLCEEDAKLIEKEISELGDAYNNLLRKLDLLSGKIFKKNIETGEFE